MPNAGIQMRQKLNPETAHVESSYTSHSSPYQLPLPSMENPDAPTGIGLEPILEGWHE